MVSHRYNHADSGVIVRQRPGVNYLICNLCLIDFFIDGNI